MVRCRQSISPNELSKEIHVIARVRIGDTLRSLHVTQRPVRVLGVSCMETNVELYAREGARSESV
jgi:hypothetical protein